MSVWQAWFSQRNPEVIEAATASNQWAPSANGSIQLEVERYDGQLHFIKQVSDPRILDSVTPIEESIKLNDLCTLTRIVALASNDNKSAGEISGDAIAFSCVSRLWLTHEIPLRPMPIVQVLPLDYRQLLRNLWDVVFGLGLIPKSLAMTSPCLEWFAEQAQIYFLNDKSKIPLAINKSLYKITGPRQEVSWHMLRSPPGLPFPVPGKQTEWTIDAVFGLALEKAIEKLRDDDPLHVPLVARGWANQIALSLLLDSSHMNEWQDNLEDLSNWPATWNKRLRLRDWPISDLYHRLVKMADMQL